MTIKPDPAESLTVDEIADLVQAWRDGADQVTLCHPGRPNLMFDFKHSYVARAIAASFHAQAKTYDARVTELLEANNREVERRRAAEAKLKKVLHATDTLAREMGL